MFVLLQTWSLNPRQLPGPSTSSTTTKMYDDLSGQLQNGPTVAAKKEQLEVEKPMQIKSKKISNNFCHEHNHGSCKTPKEKLLQNNLVTRMQNGCHETGNILSTFGRKIITNITLKTVTGKITTDPRNVKLTGFISTVSLIIMPQFVLITFIEYTKYKARSIETNQNPYTIEKQLNNKNNKIKFNIIPVVRATSEESEESEEPEQRDLSEIPEKPPHMKFTDLSIYNSPHSEYNEYQEQKDKPEEYKQKLLHNWLYSHVRENRSSLADKVGITEWCDVTSCEAKDMFAAMEISGNRLLSFLRDENNSPLRKAIIAIGTAIGAFLGSTKFYISRNIFFGMLAGTFTGWLCYPDKTDRVLRAFTYNLGNIIVRFLNLTGVDISLTKRGPVPCRTDLCKGYAKDCSGVDWRDCQADRLKRSNDEHAVIQKIIDKHRSICEERRIKAAKEEEERNMLIKPAQDGVDSEEAKSNIDSSISEPEDEIEDKHVEKDDIPGDESKLSSGSLRQEKDFYEEDVIHKYASRGDGQVKDFYEEDVIHKYSSGGDRQEKDFYEVH